MDSKEYAARLTVIERAIVDLAVLVEQLRQDAVDTDRASVVGSEHDPETLD